MTIRAEQVTPAAKALLAALWLVIAWGVAVAADAPPSAAGQAAPTREISGAGATFPAPLYAKWADGARRETRIALDYKPLGSEAGQDQISRRLADFGATDIPLSADRLSRANLVQFPTVVGAIVVIVNLPRVHDGTLRLSGELLADIFLGRIRKWNDPRLAALNPDLPLPNLTIAPIHRYDPSGTSFVFTSYLSAVSAGWKAGPGAGDAVKWPVGAGAQGSDGLATTVSMTRGAIGYVEYSFAHENHLTLTRLRDGLGAFVAPEPGSFAAAVAAANWAVPNFAVDLLNIPRQGAWPIMSATFILVPRDPSDPARARAVLDFFDFAYQTGGPAAEALNYFAVPAKVHDQVRAIWRDEIASPSGPVYK